MKKIHPVLLAGGYGTRLWPLSRQSYPKQFSKIIGDHTLFQQAALRLITSSQVKFERHITLTHEQFRFIAREQFQGLDISQGPIITEPQAKNTAPAILAAALFVHSSEPSAIMLAVPSDHVMPDTEDFHKAIVKGLDCLQDGKMVTFGISPTHAEVGYGYLELEHQCLDDFGMSSVRRFVEKPDRESIERMLEVGNQLWNSGIFLFRVADLIAAFVNYSSDTLKITNEAIRTAKQEPGLIRLNPKPWKQLEDRSIDYEIMEKAKNLVAIRYPSKWSDLGGWGAVWSETINDPSGMSTSGNAHAIDCRNTLLRSESKCQQVVGLGLDNIVAIAMADAVLVANKNRAQDVKQVVGYLRKKSIRQADDFLKEKRPWGWFECLALGDSFQVKCLCVKSGAALSLQSHSHRSEHWIVVEGTAKVTIDGEVKLVSKGHSVYVPLGVVHRLKNLGKTQVVLIEVQIGTYFGEDDIVRYEDIYARS